MGNSKRNVLYERALADAPWVEPPYPEAFRRALIKHAVYDADNGIPILLETLPFMKDLTAEDFSLLKRSSDANLRALVVSLPGVSWSEVEQLLELEERPKVLEAAFSREDVPLAFLERCRGHSSARVRLAAISSPTAPFDWAFEDVGELHALGNEFFKQDIVSAADSSASVASALLSLDLLYTPPRDAHRMPLTDHAMLKFLEFSIEGLSSSPPSRNYTPDFSLHEVLFEFYPIEHVAATRPWLFLQTPLPAYLERLLERLAELVPYVSASSHSYELPNLLGSFLISHRPDLSEVFDLAKEKMSIAQGADLEAALLLACEIVDDPHSSLSRALVGRILENPSTDAKIVVKLSEGALPKDAMISVATWLQKHAASGNAVFDEALCKTLVGVLFTSLDRTSSFKLSDVSNVEMALALTAPDSPFMKESRAAGFLCRRLRPELFEQVIERIPWLLLREAAPEKAVSRLVSSSGGLGSFFEVFGSLEGDFVGTFGELLEVCKNLA